MGGGGGKGLAPKKKNRFLKLNSGKKFVTSKIEGGKALVVGRGFPNDICIRNGVKNIFFKSLGSMPSK